MSTGNQSPEITLYYLTYLLLTLYYITGLLPDEEGHLTNRDTDLAEAHKAFFPLSSNQLWA